MSDQTVQTLQIVKRKDADASDIDVLDLLSLPVELQYEGWQQALPQPGASSVDEVVTLLMNAGNANTLATALQAIDTKIKETQWAQDPLNPVGTWLRSQLQGETGQRQAFILDMSRPQAGLGITNPLAYSGIVPDYGLGIKRMPVWENVLAQSITSSAISAHGGTVSYTVAGDAHARIAKTEIASATIAYRDTWIGVKSGRYGVTPANFVPVWKYWTLVGLDTFSAADGTAVSGFKYYTDFSSATTMQIRFRGIVSDQTVNTNDQRGRYLALLRAKISNSSLNANVRIGQGYQEAAFASAQSVAHLPRVNITGTAAAAGWRYYPLGTIKLPAIDGIFEETLDYSALFISAEKISGTGNLEVDCVTLIPAEHTMGVSLVYYGYGNVISGPAALRIITRPDKRSYAISHKSSIIFEAALVTPTVWSIPSGSGVIVYAAQGTTSVNTDTLTPTMTVYPSYNSLRGSA